MILAIINTQELCNICKYVRIVKRFGPLRDMSVMLEFSKLLMRKCVTTSNNVFRLEKTKMLIDPQVFGGFQNSRCIFFTIRYMLGISFNIHS